MGSANSTMSDLESRLSKVRENFNNSSASGRPDPAFLRNCLAEVEQIGKDLNEAIKNRQVKSVERSVTDLKAAMKKLQDELSSMLSKVEKELYAETVGKIAEKFFPDVLAEIKLYKKAAGEVNRKVEIDEQVLVGYLTGKPQATIRWQEFAQQEFKDIIDIPKKYGEKRDAVILAWNMLQAAIGRDSKVIQEAKEQDKKDKAAAFQGYLDKAEKQLTEKWGAESDGTSRLRTAVTAFRQDVANAGWNITEHTTQAFYGEAGEFSPDDLLLNEKDRDQPGADYYNIEELQAIGHGTSHGDRIRGYIKDKVAPKAHRAGLNAKNDAVISFVRAVATEWCSAVESSNTGGNPSMVANFSRGDMISTIRDLPDESKAASLSLDERIALMQMKLSKEIDPGKAEKLKKTLTNLQQQKENL